ncbi:MAG TPA: phosphoglycerate dehydrogenase [Haliangiales bacterium]|nr:phosphoglycerate dehydrogenase [Haliangiales bacterium]
MFKVLVADDLSPRGVDILRGARSSIEVDVKVGLKPAELMQVIGAYDALVVRSATKVTGEILEAAQNLKIIGRAGIGVDNIDVRAASRRGIIVENTPSGNATTAAEHALCLLLSMARFIPQATASMKSGRWEKRRFQGVEICDKTLGVVGLGNIGRIVADRARGLKMKVVAYDPFISTEAAARLGAELVTLDELFARADFISLHTPLTAETKNLIGVESLAKMKDGVYIVNAARGGIVDEDALLAALDSGKVAGAALDVFVKEPPDAGSRLVAHDRVVSTPHLGASTDEAQEKVAVEVAEQIIAFVERGEVHNAVNVAPLPPDLQPRVAPWLDLGGRLGLLLGQIVPRGGSIDEVEIEVTGELAELAGTAVARAALAGLLRSFCDVPVNEVNAPLIAAERGLRVAEVKRARGDDFAASISLRALGALGHRLVKGTILHLGEQAEPRVVRIDDYMLDAQPEGRILFIRNADKPGVIGGVGTLLGHSGINVGRLHVGRGRARGTAIMLWQVDAELGAALLDEVRRLPHIEHAQQVVL